MIYFRLRYYFYFCRRNFLFIWIGFSNFVMNFCVFSIWGMFVFFCKYLSGYILNGFRLFYFSLCFLGINKGFGI